MPKDQDYAIVIGIDSYPALRRLNAAVRDSVRFLEWLTSPAGGDVPAKNIRHIQSPAQNGADAFASSVKPLQGEVDQALRDFGITLKPLIGRRLYFYFAGHGLGTRFDDVGMLMANATPDSLGSNIGLGGYLSMMHERGLFDEVVFILDCCRDPALNVTTGRPPFTFGESVTPRQIENLVILAAEFGAKAFEKSQATSTGPEPRGVLTDALIEGLNGAAANADGIITAMSLREFLIERVPQAANADPRLRQLPRIDRVPTKEMVFAVTPVQPAIVRIIAPPNLGGELVVADAKGNEVARRASSEAEEARPPWEVHLPKKNSRYMVEHTLSTAEAVLDPRTFKEPPHVYRFPAQP